MEVATGTLGGFMVLDYTFGIDLLLDAEPRMRFAQYVTRVDRPGAKAGESITVPTIGTMDLSGTTALTEGTAITVSRLTLGSANVSISEYARSLGWTGKLDAMSWFALDPQLKRKLLDSYAKTIDALARAAYFGAATTGTYVTVALGPTTAPGTVYSSGTGTGTATDELTYNCIEHAVDQLRGRDVPPFEDEGGEYYVGIFTPAALRGLKHDPNYQNAHLYSGARALLRGEDGELEGVRFLTTTNIPAYAPAGGATTYPHGVIFGMDAVGRAVAMEMELRVELDKDTDFGRQKAIAWVSLEGFGPLMTAHVQEVQCLAGKYTVQ
jgi:N4-gp56 family major capsid protein